MEVLLFPYVAPFLGIFWPSVSDPLAFSCLIWPNLMNWVLDYSQDSIILGFIFRICQLAVI